MSSISIRKLANKMMEDPRLLKLCTIEKIEVNSLRVTPLGRNWLFNQDEVSIEPRGQVKRETIKMVKTMKRDSIASEAHHPWTYQRNTI